MTPIALNHELVAKLTANGGHVPLTDTDGKSIGHFLSPAVYESVRLMVLEQAKAEVTLAEFRQSLANPKRHTMDEIFKLVEGD
jgi:hypothetical protein